MTTSATLESVTSAISTADAALAKAIAALGEFKSDAAANLKTMIEDLEKRLNRLRDQQDAERIPLPFRKRV
jgi:phage-related minor tail protein